ncbi:DUF3336 domain-containing protein [Deltaproteobacteria bacterium TL4]
MSDIIEKQRCKQAMHQATTYQEWQTAALELDHVEGNDKWKEQKESQDYNYKLIELRLEQLKKCKESNDIRQMVFYLREGLHRNHGNIANPKLYSKTHVGTKQLIEDYIDELTSSLKFLCDNEFEEFPFYDKIRFFDECSRSFGKSALLLSGGAMSGLFHIGVIKALDEQNLIPSVVSGSSVGAIMAGALATFTDLNDLYDPEKLNLDIWKVLPLDEIIKQKSLMDSKHMIDFLNYYALDMTLEEAYRKTGRHLNVTVSPAIKNHAPKVLNYLNAPHLLGWSAILASCAVPGIFPPVQLMAKDHHGNTVPYMSDCKWSDGALTSDLPMKRLSELYNVNHSIVSQVNPHIIPFISDKPDESNVFSSIKNALMTEGKTLTRFFIRTLQFFIREKRTTQGLEMLHDILNQKYVGDITIRMTPKFSTYTTLLKNPSNEHFLELVRDGERATWPKINMIYHQTQIGQTLEDCLKQLQHSRRTQQRSRQSDNAERQNIVELNTKIA